MNDTSSGEAARPAMSLKSVDAAAGTARAQLTHRHLVPADPGHPLVDGGFWGAFTRSLEGRWEQIKRDHAKSTNTFDSDDADGQTRLVTDGGTDSLGDVVEQRRTHTNTRDWSACTVDYVGNTKAVVPRTD